jgi:hypothetical protein
LLAFEADCILWLTPQLQSVFVLLPYEWYKVNFSYINQEFSDARGLLMGEAMVWK